MSHQTVIVLDFGGQYNQLIARRVRECGVYCEVKPYTTPLEQLKAMPRAAIESGLAFCGFLLFNCPLKSTTRSTVQALLENRYRVKIITGDNPYTACEIAKQCGIVAPASEVLVLASSPAKWDSRSPLISRLLYWESLATQTRFESLSTDPSVLAALQKRFVLVLNGAFWAFS